MNIFQWMSKNLAILNALRNFLRVSTIPSYQAIPDKPVMFPTWRRLSDLAGPKLDSKPIRLPDLWNQSQIYSIILVKYLFNLAYFLIGMGNIPMVTLTLSYICENNFYGNIETNYHYALYHAGTAFGPAVGMLVAGQFTNVWVDWYDKGLSPPGELSTDSKLWVGTWWLPYWIVSGLLFIIGLFIVCCVPETSVIISSPSIRWNTIK